MPKIAQLLNISSPTTTVLSKRASGCYKRASGKGNEKDERRIIRKTEARRKERKEGEHDGPVVCGRSLRDSSEQSSTASPRDSLLQGSTISLRLTLNLILAPHLDFFPQLNGH